MKKFLIAAAATLLIFGGQVEAAPADDLNADIETQDIHTSKWANFRDKYILNRETDNERRDRKNWERRHRYDPPPPPPPYYRDGRRYYPPPSPPPPPRYREDGRKYYPPPPPPPPPPMPPTRRR